MSNDVSGFGLRVRVLASKTYPGGVTLSQFADDADPFDSPSLQIANVAMGVNGDLVTWSVASPVAITLNLIPGSDDDKAMSVLLEQNRVARGRLSARDDITLVALYPDGRQSTLSGGKITNGVPVRSVASSGRQKSRPYQFAFESLAGS